MARERLLAVEIMWLTFEGEGHPVIGHCSLRLVNPTGASDHLEESVDREPTTLFVWGLYIRRVAGSSSLSWPFALT